MSAVPRPLQIIWDHFLLPVQQIVVLTWQAIDRHQTLDRAAIISFYAAFSVIPFLGLVFVVALGMIEGLGPQLLSMMHGMVPVETETLFREQVDKIQESPPVGVLSISFIMLLWSSSSMFVSVMDAMNIAHGVRDSRAWWQRRLRAIALTLIESILVLGATALMLTWPHVVDWLGLTTRQSTLATLAQWGVVLVALLISFSLADFFGPDVDKRWSWLTPGSLLSAILFVGVSLGLKIFLQYGRSSSEVYGAMAGVIVLLFWFYLAATSFLIGADLNSAIRQRTRATATTTS